MEGSAGGNWPVDQQQQPPPPPQPHTAYPPIPPPPHLSSQTHHYIPPNNSSYNYPNSFYHHPNSLPSSFSDAAAAATAAANLQHFLYYYNHPGTSSSNSTITHDYSAASSFSDPAAIAASLRLQGFENVDPVAYQIALLSAQSGLDPAFTNASAGVWNQTYSKFKGGLAGKFPKKKNKIVQSAYCATCKIDCNCVDAYRKHIVGKKHLKNIKLLEERKKQKMNPTSAAPAAPTAPGKTRANSMSDQGKSNANCPSVPVGTNSNTNVIVEKHTFEPATKEELEIKRQKVLNQGAAATGVRICTLCNTVCNSEIVFSIHLAGKKHALMLQKQVEANAAASMLAR